MHKMYAFKYNNKDEILIGAQNGGTTRNGLQTLLYMKRQRQRQRRQHQRPQSNILLFGVSVSTSGRVYVYFLCFSDIKILFFLPQNLLHNKFS